MKKGGNENQLMAQNSLVEKDVHESSSHVNNKALGTLTAWHFSATTATDHICCSAAAAAANYVLDSNSYDIYTALHQNSQLSSRENRTLLFSILILECS